MRVDVIGATLRFDGRVVFEGLTGRFESATVTALTGPSGSGKSSLLAAMAGYQPLNSGRIEISRDSDQTPLPPSPSLVAWVPQGSNALGRRTVLDNVLVAPLGAGLTMSHSVERSREMLASVGLERKANQQARSLSGGELQRLALARALASTRPLIFVDEPSANLDAENTNTIAAILNGLSSSATIIVATHDPVLIEAAGAYWNIRGGLNGA